METKKNILGNLDFRSENVQEILNSPPKWIIRWGNLIIFSAILTILLLSYLIKYPEFIAAPIVVTSQNPPEKIESRINSKIEKIFVVDHQRVKVNKVLLVLQSNANSDDVLKLKKIVDSISQSQLINFPLNETGKLKLGDIQNDYNVFAKSLSDEILFKKLKPYSSENIAANENIFEYKGRILTVQDQLYLEEKKFDLSRKDYERSNKLYNEGVISKMELENDKIKFLQAEQNLKNIKVSLSQLNEGLSNIQKNKKGIEINNEKDKINFNSSKNQQFEQLRKSLRLWEQNYLIMSSNDGVVSFAQFLGKNQFVKTGDFLLSIIPDDKKAIIGRMYVPAYNSGKINIGQKVIVKLDNYRFQEFGVIVGRVYNISLAPDLNGNYYVEVIFKNELKTNFNKIIPFDKELKGNAQIVTQDLRLIERFFQQLNTLLSYQN